MGNKTAHKAVIEWVSKNRIVSASGEVFSAVQDVELHALLDDGDSDLKWFAFFPIFRKETSTFVFDGSTPRSGLFRLYEKTRRHGHTLRAYKNAARHRAGRTVDKLPAEAEKYQLQIATDPMLMLAMEDMCAMLRDENAVLHRSIPLPEVFVWYPDPHDTDPNAVLVHQGRWWKSPLARRRLVDAAAGELTFESSSSTDFEAEGWPRVRIAGRVSQIAKHETSHIEVTVVSDDDTAIVYKFPPYAKIVVRDDETVEAGQTLARLIDSAVPNNDLRQMFTDPEDGSVSYAYWHFAGMFGRSIGAYLPVPGVKNRWQFCLPLWAVDVNRASVPQEDMVMQLPVGKYVVSFSTLRGLSAQRAHVAATFGRSFLHMQFHRNEHHAHRKTPSFIGAGAAGRMSIEQFSSNV